MIRNMEPAAMSAYSVDSGIQYATDSGNIINSFYYSPPAATSVFGAFAPTNGQNSAQYPANNGFPIKIISVTEPANPPTMPNNPGPPLTATTSAYAFGYAANNGVQYAADKSYYVPITVAPAPSAPTSGTIPSLIPGGPVRFNMTTDASGVVNVPQGVVGLAARGVQAGVDNFYYQASADQNLPQRPSGPPTIPTQLGGKTDTSIPVQFDTAGISGSQPISYGIYVSTTNPPTGPLIAASQLSGTVFYAAPTGLVASTTYYISSVADNGVGDPQVSAPLVISTTATPTNPAPAPGIPYVSPTIPPTETTITIEFDAAGVTGTPSVTLASLLANGLVPATAVIVTGTIYRSVYTGLSAGINYVFQSTAVGAIPTGIVFSGLSAPIQTGGPPPPGPSGTLPAPTLVTSGYDSLVVQFDTSAVVGATSYVVYRSNTTTLLLPPFPAILGAPNTYSATVTGLYNNTPYYFWAEASNAYGTLRSAIGSPITTDMTTGTSPSDAPTSPTFVSSTPTSLTFDMDTAGITGTPAPQYLMVLKIESSTIVQQMDASIGVGTTYRATFDGLSSLVSYQCQGQSYNGLAPNKASLYGAPVMPA